MSLLEYTALLRQHLKETHTYTQTKEVKSVRRVDEHVYYSVFILEQLHKWQEFNSIYSQNLQICIVIN